jgi:hypothetical protein
MGRRAGAAVLPALLLAALLGTTACGQTPPRAIDPGTPPPTPVTASPTDGNGALVPPNLDTSITPSPIRHASGPVVGADVSWPQCPKGMGIAHKRSEGAPMPDQTARFLVVGLTNGPSFAANPCLADQVAWARAHGLPLAAYSVVTYPDATALAALRGHGPYDGSTRLGALGNVGYQAALFNVRSMTGLGISTPAVWVDVEPVPFYDWSGDTTANAAVVKGAVRGYRSAGYRVGVYSVPSLWQRVVGDLHLGLPEWRAAGQTSQAEALHRCSSPEWSFNGGPAVLGQWVADGRDRDVTCPGADLRRWFPRP